ncbi:MAG: DUF6583 family protein [Clostridia bacterium]|nr:unknown [Clostridium sp. CAG:389]
MMARKKRITIITIAIVLVIAIIIGILAFLYIKTDAFKSNETLFAKYLVQNFDIIEVWEKSKNTDIENLLDTNKYTSQIEGKIEYTENKGTSNEKQSSSVNNVGIKITSNIDKSNNYNYSDISIGTENEKLVGLEYLNEDDKYGIRLKDIQQFVSIKKDDETQESELKNIEKLTENIDVQSIIKFSDEEKQTLKNTYLEIIKNNVSKEKYHKQSNSLITVNNKDMQTNAYYIEFTVEECNNLYIKILEQIAKDEIILSKVDLIEKQIKEIDEDYDGNLRENFVKSIKDKIKEIEDKNIGNDKVKITVYEKNMKTVRTSIEKNNDKTIIDLYDSSSIKIDTVKIDETTDEQYIKIESKNDGTNLNVLVEYAKIQDNNTKNTVQFNYGQTFLNNELNKNIELGISNEKNEAIIKISDDTNFVQEFENEITLEKDNVDLDELDEEQSNAINGILTENVQSQLSNLLAVVNLNDYVSMLQNLGLMNKTSIELPSDGEVTETERKRFNSQFEFFVSEGLTSDNIKELIDTAENNFEDMKVLLKNGEIQDLDLDKINSSRESSDYKKEISEILFYIKRNSNNEEKKANLLTYLEKESGNKYNVSIEYDADGLTRIIRAKIQEK